VACGRTPRASDVATPFGHPPCCDANAIQLEKDPHIAFANLIVQGVKSVVERVVTKDRRRGLIAQDIEGSGHMRSVRSSFTKVDDQD
jgi:hypothetical protein